MKNVITISLKPVGLKSIDLIFHSSKRKMRVFIHHTHARARVFTYLRIIELAATEYKILNKVVPQGVVQRESKVYGISLIYMFTLKTFAEKLLYNNQYSFICLRLTSFLFLLARTWVSKTLNNCKKHTTIRSVVGVFFYPYRSLRKCICGMEVLPVVVR